MEKFTLINKDRSRIKVFEPFEDVSKPSPTINLYQSNHWIDENRRNLLLTLLKLSGAKEIRTLDILLH